MHENVHYILQLHVCDQVQFNKIKFNFQMEVFPMKWITTSSISPSANFSNTKINKQKT